MNTSTYLRQTLPLLWVISGCSSSGKVPLPIVPPVVSLPSENIKSFSKQQWLPKISAEYSSYVIVDTSMVVISDDATSRHLPINKRVIYSISMIPRGDFYQLSAIAESLSINSQPQLSITQDTVASSTVSPILLSKQGQIISFTQSPTTMCATGIDPIAARLFELTYTRPSIAAGVASEWSDTISTTICHSKLALTEYSTRSYKLLAFTTWQQHSVIEIQRNISTQLTNAHRNSSTNLEATGSGKATDTLYVDSTTGQLLESTRVSQLQLNVVIAGRVFPFTQTTHTHVERQSP